QFTVVENRSRHLRGHAAPRSRVTWRCDTPNRDAMFCADTPRSVSSRTFLRRSIMGPARCPADDGEHAPAPHPDRRSTPHPTRAATPTDASTPNAGHAPKAPPQVATRRTTPEYRGPAAHSHPTDCRESATTSYSPQHRDVPRDTTAATRSPPTLGGDAPHRPPASDRSRTPPDASLPGWGWRGCGRRWTCRSSRSPS